jgi:hypothetical protein
MATWDKWEEVSHKWEEVGHKWEEISHHALLLEDPQLDGSVKNKNKKIPVNKKLHCNNISQLSTKSIK